MHALELLIPACMNLANLLPSPLNAASANADFPGSPSQRDGLSHRNHCTARRRHRNIDENVISTPTAQRIVLDSSIARAAVAAALVATSSADKGDGGDKGGAADETNDTQLPPQQLDYPANSHPNAGPTTEAPGVRPTRPRRHQAQPSTSASGLVQPNRLLSPPFRTRAAAYDADSDLLRRIGNPGRLWNPANSTPRLPPAIYTRPIRTPRKRRPSTPLPPSIPFSHPTLDDNRLPDDQVATGAGDYPLLTLPEQRQSRHPTPTRTSFQVDGRLNEGKRISIPSAVRHSYDTKRTLDAPSDIDPEPGPVNPKSKGNSIASSFPRRGQSVTNKGRSQAVSFGLIPTQSTDQSAVRIDKGKGKAVMPLAQDDHSPRGPSTDLERGPAVLGQQQNRSNASLPIGIGSAISSNSSIIGDPDQPGLGDEWGPQHPCFPHLNPYVPTDSTEYRTTRIIRVRRDWLIAGDLAPTFSNMYPEILDPAGISEQEFRRVIEKLNGSLIPIFNPYSWRNILDGVLGVLSAWIWEDLGVTNIKTKLNDLEKWIDKWNMEMEKTVGSEDGAIAPKIISLRRTGYMSLDFQIPNPEVSISNSEPASRSGPPLPEPVASTAT
ncbi:Golgin subfamily A member 7/ERF4 family-domain-containing protein [Xylaria palmicola]|nr:Golgin subfamily A member 7/ERF4 family-domain-containing protein [Xylaria palmicola]